MIKIFITGASSGIGQALAHEYAKRYKSKAVIGLLARRHDAILALTKTLEKEYSSTCVCYPCDVRDSQAVADAANSFIETFGTPNIVIANAGVSTGTLTEHQEDIDAFQAVMDINLMGMVHTFQPFISAMKLNDVSDGQRHLVGVASVAGIRGLPGAGAYSASKAAAITYLESLRVEMQLFNIHVTTIAPGYIRTPMTDINTYPMPFLLDVAVFASKFADAVDRNKRFVIIPWQMGILAKIMRMIPDWLWDRIMKNAPHKSKVKI